MDDLFTPSLQSPNQSVPSTPLVPAKPSEPSTPPLPDDASLYDREKSTVTPLRQMYDFFLAGITDDMFMEITRDETDEILDEILMAALPEFEFPRKNIFDIDWERREFRCQLSSEEMMIIRQYMIAAWISYQLASVENIRQKYSSSDFQFTSQASHMNRLLSLKQEYEKRGFHLQRLYCRRRVNKDGQLESTMDQLAGGYDGAR